VADVLGLSLDELSGKSAAPYRKQRTGSGWRIPTGIAEGVARPETVGLLALRESVTAVAGEPAAAVRSRTGSSRISLSPPSTVRRKRMTSSVAAQHKIALVNYDCYFH
jgi:hypothetical protein